MGWAGGTYVMEALIKGFKKEVKSEESRKKLYKVAIEALWINDWDTEMECLGMDVAFDEALREIAPSFFEDEDEWE